jgi:hypothetical protein
MHPQDYELFSAMQTVELGKRLVRRKQVRFDAEEAKLTTKSMSNLVESKSLSKKTYRYYLKIMKPGDAGFTQRWHSFLSRYTEVFLVSTALANKSDLERLELALEHVCTQYGAITKVGISNTEHFSDDESEAVAKQGFLALAKSELEHVDDDGFFTDLVSLSCYAPNEKAGMNFMRTLQTYGFLMYEPDTDVKPKKVGFIALLGDKFKYKKAA